MVNRWWPRPRTRRCASRRSWSSSENVVREYLDVVGLADHLGLDRAVEILSHIDEYYVDRSGESGSVLTSLVIALADPKPRDTEVIDELPRYKGLAARYHRWNDVVETCRDLALRLGGVM